MTAEIQVAVRVIKAELCRSFDWKGKMDPFCRVSWATDDGRKWEIARTKTHWKGHMRPEWNHTTRAQPYFISGGDLVEFCVLEENFGGYGIPTFCGSAAVPISELVTSIGSSSKQQPVMETPIQELCLEKRGERTGTITVQAILIRDSPDNESCDQEDTAIDEDMFTTPVHQIDVAGGTAPFFRLQLQPGKGQYANQSASYYIGKDLSHATDELGFYEDVLRLQRAPGRGGFGPLLDFMLEYAGIFTAPAIEGGGDPTSKDLLVMRNLFDGCANLRLLDIKIGKQTAAAGWQGKSKLAAMRNNFVDGLTNSVSEGFRLEGFGGAPAALKSMDPLLDIKDWGQTVGRQDSKKALRLSLQRMHAPEVLMHFYDIRQSPADQGNADLRANRSPTEVAEIVSHEVATRLVQLALACRRAPVPQKWIGSSVALGFDSDVLRPREQAEASVRASVKVNIFDWGRSEFNTVEKHMQLAENERQNRAKFWKYYVDGIDRLAWEAVRSYMHRFNHKGAWNLLEVTLYDFDSMSDNDFMCSTTLELIETPRSTVQLLDSRGRVGTASMTYAIERRNYCGLGSRFSEAWRVHIISASNLPIKDHLVRKSDPFVVFSAHDETGNYSFEQQTSVVVNSLNPEWNETFELPRLDKPGHLSHSLESLNFDVDHDLLLRTMLPDNSNQVDMDEAMAMWKHQLDTAEKVRSEHVTSASGGA